MQAERKGLQSENKEFQNHLTQQQIGYLTFLLLYTPDMSRTL